MPTNTVRILFVNPYYKPYLGGIERIIEQVGAELLAREEVEAVGVLTTRIHFPDRWMHGVPPRERIDGIDVFRCRFFPSRIPRVFHAALAGYISPQVASVVSSFEPDVIHFTYSEWWGANLSIYFSTLRLPHVMSTFFHDNPHIPTTLPLYTVNRWLVPRMHAVHVLTEMERRQVHEAYGVPLQRAVVIPPGVDLDPHMTARTREDATTILAVGRLNPDKGQLALVRMVAKLRQTSEAPPLRLWLVGENAGAEVEIKRFCQSHGLDGIVQIFGHVSDEELLELYREADIFALPTRVESFGLVFLEAMAHALPVVTYGVGPIPTILTHGAVVVPPGDEAGFCDSLADLILSPQRRRRLGHEGRDLVHGLYSWRSMADRLLRVYEQTLHAPLDLGTM
jgi:glycosyltransferase involved in cell wall biosynthesis